MDLTGTIIGYDPGGNNCNGFAALEIINGKAVDIQIQTLSNAENVINEVNSRNNIIGLGVDTLSCWCTGQSGWRPADKWLRLKYPKVRNSITSPNSLSGSMAINGMSVLMEVSNVYKNITLSETHPKVLYYALTGKKYNYLDDNNSMDDLLASLLSIKVSTKNDHEWDAVISAYALFQGLNNSWEVDLHALPLEKGSRFIFPCRKTAYYWPE